MAGHSKWAQIKHKKEVTDKKRGVVFSKILMAIGAAARQESNPDFNPRLRTLIEKAKEANIPQENIERAVNKAKENANLEELRIEAYGPEKAALVIEAITDNKNRTINEVKNILNEHQAKMAEPGAVMWAFETSQYDIRPKYAQPISDDAKEKLTQLIDALEAHNDVHKVITNTQ